MDADSFARRCLRRLTGTLTLEDQWIPSLPDYLVEYCQDIGIDPLPGALMAHFREAYGVTVTQVNKKSMLCHVTIPDQEAADTLMSIFRSVPLTLIPPLIRIVDADGKTAPMPINPETRKPRVTWCSVHYMKSADGETLHPYLSHLCELWAQGNNSDFYTYPSIASGE
jgi:hypothetical protein